jgi:ATP-dependent DNA helicase RecQ
MKISIADIERHIKNRFKIEAFRPGQFEIIKDVLLGHNVCASIPTGAGKSLVYQSMAVLAKSTVLVVEPYISLIRDQIAEAKMLSIPAASFHSDMTEDEQHAFVENMRDNKLRLLFVTPERFASEEFNQFLLTLNVARIIIDEAHAVVSMGEGFRPAYSMLGKAISDFNRAKVANGENKASVTFLSATLTDSTIQKLVEQFELNDVKKHIIRSKRHNIRIGVEKMSNDQKISRSLELARQTSAYGATLIYVSCKLTANILYDRFKLRGLDVGVHHASLSTQERVSVLEWYKSSENGILITTSALSAGFNKQNIRTVVHFHPPRTIEDYVQEIGRGGRDGKDAEAFCLFDVMADRKLNESLYKSSSPEPNIIAGFAFFIAEKLSEQHSIRITADKMKLEYGLRDITHGALRTLLSHAKAVGAVDFIEDGKTFDIALFDRVNHNKLIELINSSDESRSRFNAMLELLDFEGCKHDYVEQYFAGLSPSEAKKTCSCCYENVSLLSKSNLSDNQIRTHLMQLRQKRAKGFGVPAFMLLPSEAIEVIIRNKPQKVEDLYMVSGMDESRIQFIGKDILGVINGA